MKTLHYILATVLAGGMMTACSDGKADVDPVLTPTQVTETSMKEGATVDILLYKTLSVDYSHPIEITDASKVTLNGQPVKNLKSDVCRLSMDLDLQPATEYTLSVESGAVKRYGVEDFPGTYTVHFSTRALPVVDKEPINKNATAEVKALYAALLSVYGEKTLSGAMGAAAWGNGYYDFITGMAGKAPAVIGFDFEELAASPSATVDYGDITPVKKAWGQGAVPMISWHWKVPRTNKKGARLDTKPSSFKASNATTAGTWENGVVNADLKKLAGYLKNLQDAGIPVIFRPLPEAAGDYASGAIYWWGDDGLEATAQLWDYIYKTLTEEYGINNLLWEWTAVVKEGGALAPTESIKNAYIGDAKCDLVGVDFYSTDDLFSDFDTFYAVREAIAGKKMIALSECGKLFDPDLCFGKGETWLYFMQASEESDGGYGVVNYSPGSVWKKVMDSAYTLDNKGVAELLSKFRK